MKLGSIGVWSGQLRRGTEAEAVNAATELERLGFGALWMPGGGEGVFERARVLLAATSGVVVATGIISIWSHRAADVAASHHAVTEAYPGRFLLGLGVSHARMVDRDSPGRYGHPLKKMEEYMDHLDVAPNPVPKDERVLAALGPRMLELARDRSAGTHPYLVPTSHTRRARNIVGADRLVAPEQAVVLETDVALARQIGREHLATYLRLPNYTNNLLREGFTTGDIADGGSDHLVDAVVAWGDPESVMNRVREHHQAGADHVCIQVLSRSGQGLPMKEWRALSAALRA